MATVYIFFAKGFEEIEGLTVVDLLRRADIDVKMVGITAEETVTGAHGIRIITDMSAADVDLADAAALVLPGGMPGTKNLGNCEVLTELLKQAAKQELTIAAICAAPSVLGDLGLLKGKKAVCYPGFEDRLTDAEVLYEPVVTDGNIITSRGMGTAIDFGLELISRFAGAEKAKAIAEAIIYA